MDLKLQPEMLKMLSGLVQANQASDKGRTEADAEMDFWSCYPFSHLNFIFNQLVPVAYIQSSKIKQKHLKQKQEAESFFTHLNNVSIERYGPAIEGLAMPILIPRKPDQDENSSTQQQTTDIEETDRKWLIVVEDKRATYKSDPHESEAKYIVEEVAGQPGIVRLQIRDPKLTEVCKYNVDGKWYISGQELQNKMVEIMMEHCSSASNTSCEGAENVATTSGDTKADQTNKATQNMDVETTRKAQQNETLESNVEMKCLRDMVIAIPCETWPHVADKWLQRKRKSDWPAESMIEEMKRKGFRLIPRRQIGPKSKHRVTEWEIVFDTEKLCKSFSDTQKQCLMLLKLIRFHSFCLPNILTNEHMLHLMFWVNETVDNWKPENLGENLCVCLDKLFDFLAEGHFPHYFIDDANMLSGVSEDHKLDLINILDHVMHDLVTEIYTFNERYRTNYQPKQRTLRQLFAVLTDGAQTDSEVICKQKQADCARDLADALIADELYSAACIAFSVVGNGEAYLANKAIQSSSLDHGIEIHQFLIDAFPQSTTKYSHLANMACLYHSKFIECEVSTQKEELKMKTQNTFNEALNIPFATSASKADYCVFLIGIGEYNQAIPLLAKVVNLTEDENGNEYGPLEKKTLPAELHPWVDHLHTLNVYSVNLSQFLLIKCYTATEQVKDAYPVLHQMRLFLNRLSKKKSPQCKGSQVLLVCSAQPLKRYKLACSVYEEINTQFPSPIATEGIAECKALLAEQETENSNTISDLESDGEEAVSCVSDHELSQSEFTVLNERCQDSAMAHLKELQLEEALNDFSELQRLYKLIGKDILPEELMEEACVTFEPVVVAQILEFLIEKLPNSPRIWGFHDRLGCAYFAQSLATEEEDNKEELIAKAIRTFENIRAQNTCEYECQMNYANMLYITAKYLKALELTDNMLKREADKPAEEWTKLIHTFDPRHKSIVDGNIKTELQHTTCMDVSVNILAHYITIMSAVKNDNMESAKNVFQHMAADRNKMISLQNISLSQKIHTQALIGYTALELKMFETAKSAFTWILEHATGSQKILAEENVETCLAMEMSMNDDV